MNAMILTADLHDRFGSLECYLQETSEPHTYMFHMVRGVAPLVPAPPPKEKIVLVNLCGFAESEVARHSPRVLCDAGDEWGGGVCGGAPG